MKDKWFNANEYTPSDSAMYEEINTWRKYFLDDFFEKEFKHISEYSKNIVTSYFLSIPSESFTTPLKEFHKCIVAIIENLEEKNE